MLKDQVALVTGGARGIGKGIVLGLAEEKAKVMICDIRREEGENTLSEIEAKGVEAAYFEVDVTKSDRIEKMVADIAHRFGRLDILINNAGITTHPAWCYEMSDDDWHSVINTHVDGTFYCLKASARVMKEQKYGRIVNLSSVAAVNGFSTQMNYAAAKSAIVGITLTAAKELGPYGITVNCVQPGIIRTDMSAILLEQGEDKYIRKTPTLQIGEPIDVANAVNFFVNPASKFVTGIVLRIDGGFMLPMAETEDALSAFANVYPNKG